MTRGHNIFDIEIEKEIECKEHNDEVVRFYCETCETAICILCTFNDHKDHDVAQFSDAVLKYKSNIENLLYSCQNKLEQFEGQLEVVNNCEGCIRGAEQKIRDVSIDMIADIRNREKLLIEEIHNLYGPEMMSLVGRKGELKADYDALRGTVQLTELILKGKDMELLLLKKEVQQKLESLSKSSASSLPTTASKVINFVPGMLDMGYIHDSDNPHMRRTKRMYSNTSAESQSIACEEYMINNETQTVGALHDQQEKGVNTDLLCKVDEEVQTDGAPEPAIAIVHQPSRDSDEPTHHTRYMVHQGSMDELDNRRSRSHNVASDEDGMTQRRRRRRERARTSRIDGAGERYSYPNETTPSGVYEAHYSSQQNLNHSDGSSDGRQRRRMRRYATVDD